MWRKYYTAEVIFNTFFLFLFQVSALHFSLNLFLVRMVCVSFCVVKESRRFRYAENSSNISEKSRWKLLNSGWRPLEREVINFRPGWWLINNFSEVIRFMMVVGKACKAWESYWECFVRLYEFPGQELMLDTLPADRVVYFIDFTFKWWMVAVLKPHQPGGIQFSVATLTTRPGSKNMREGVGMLYGTITASHCRTLLKNCIVCGICWYTFEEAEAE